MRRTVLVLLAVAAAAIVGGTLARMSGPPEEEAAPEVGAGPAPPTPGSVMPQSPALGPLPPSLQDSEPDGELIVGADGHLVATPSALRLFDHFLAASGEESDAMIRLRIVTEIRSRTREPAATEAEALLARYLAYRESARALTEQGAVPEDLERRFQWVRELRREHFGGDAETLFGEEEQTVRVALERRRIAQDPSLSPEEKQRRMAAAEEALPEGVRESRELARSALESKREVDALRAAGASDQEIWSARERRFGAEAADRLAALDARRADWQRRVAGYRDARAALEREPDFAALPPAQRDARIEALRARHFSGTELLRVRALDAERSPAQP